MKNKADNAMKTPMAFRKWLAERNSLLAIPMIVVKRNHASITLWFEGIIDAIEVEVMCNQIAIPVIHGGENWDMLEWFECKPKVIANGIVCDFCDPAKLAVFATHQALLQDHLFEPLAEWINSSLFLAHSLGLSGNVGGVTWAKLLFDDDHKGSDVVIPLRG